MKKSDLQKQIDELKAELAGALQRITELEQTQLRVVNIPMISSKTCPIPHYVKPFDNSIRWPVTY